VSPAPDQHLLPAASEIDFSAIDSVLSGAGADEAKRAAGLALTATIVLAGPLERLDGAAAALQQLTDVGVRTILISYGTSSEPAVRVADHVVALDGLRQDYLNNAVAALRLSSLPTLVWWRGGAPETLDGLASLADRLILDAEDPRPAWARAAVLAERTALSDLRWTRLTRWRALMSHFFDIPEVRDAAPAFDRLRVEGSDPYAARLFAGWLSSSLHWTGGVTIDLCEVAGPDPITLVELGDDDEELTLRLGSSHRCVETSVRVHGHGGASRIVSLGDQGLAALIGEELRIRSRDTAFERAVAAAQGIA
jgi:glucose-6-phosphate dehydrogenase assembly protein OpcA